MREEEEDGERRGKEGKGGEIKEKSHTSV